RRVDRGGSTRAHIENTSCGGVKNLRIYTSGDLLPFSHLAHSVQRKKMALYGKWEYIGEKILSKKFIIFWASNVCKFFWTFISKKFVLFKWLYKWLFKFWRLFSFWLYTSKEFIFFK